MAEHPAEQAAEHPREVLPERKPMGGELIIPVVAFLFTLYYFWTIIDVPWIAQVSALFVGTILIVLLIVFFVRTVLQVRRGEADLSLHTMIEPVWFLPKRLGLLGLTIGYVLVIRWFGFTLTTFVFLLLAMLLLNNGRRFGLILAISTFCSIGGYLLFVVAFKTRFPAGPFEILMKGLS